MKETTASAIVAARIIIAPWASRPPPRASPRIRAAMIATPPPRTTGTQWLDREFGTSSRTPFRPKPRRSKNPSSRLANPARSTHDNANIPRVEDVERSR